MNKINIISYKNIKSKIKSIADKNKKQKQNKINFKKIYNYNSLYEKIRAKSNIQSNKCFEDIWIFQCDLKKNIFNIKLDKNIII